DTPLDFGNQALLFVDPGFEAPKGRLAPVGRSGRRVAVSAAPRLGFEIGRGDGTVGSFRHRLADLYFDSENSTIVDILVIENHLFHRRVAGGYNRLESKEKLGCGRIGPVAHGALRQSPAAPTRPFLRTFP